MNIGPKTKSTQWWLMASGIGTALWIILYTQLHPFSVWAVTALGLPPEAHHTAALQFFIYDTPKVLMLLSLVVFWMSIIRTFFSAERTRTLLAGRREGLGNIAAAILGIFTPFCSCSAISLFIGFISAGVPLGVTFSFLIAAPMVNEIALGLLWALVGWKVALAYLLLGLAIAISAGWVIGKLKLENWLQDWVKELRTNQADLPDQYTTWAHRFQAGANGVTDIVGKVWGWMVLGIAIGALIHGYAPAETLSYIMGGETWWSVPAAVGLGIPMYANAAGIIPIVEALLDKGAALGTVLAFMMSVIALSLPEMIILRKVLTLKLIGVFIAVVGSGILCVGYLFNLFFN